MKIKAKKIPAKTSPVPGNLSSRQFHLAAKVIRGDSVAVNGLTFKTWFFIVKKIILMIVKDLSVCISHVTIDDFCSGKCDPVLKVCRFASPKYTVDYPQSKIDPKTKLFHLLILTKSDAYEEHLYISEKGFLFRMAIGISREKLSKKNNLFVTGLALEEFTLDEFLKSSAYFKGNKESLGYKICYAMRDIVSRSIVEQKKTLATLEDLNRELGLIFDRLY